jgi:outer membrane protein TolC
MKRALLNLLFLISVLPVSAQTSAFTLAEAKSYAIKNHIQAENGRSDLEIARFRIREAVASGLVQLNAGMRYDYNIETPVFIFPDFIGGNPNEFVTIPAAPLNSMVLNGSASMLLFSGRYLVGIQAAKEFEQLTREQLSLTERDLVEQVSRAYYMVLINGASAATLDSSLQALERTLRETEALFKEGFAEELDVEQLELSLSQTRDMLIQAKNGEQLALINLKYAMGFPLDQDLVCADPLSSLLDSENFEGIIATLSNESPVTQSPEYRLMARRLVLNEYQVKLERAAALPTLSTALNYNYNIFNNQRWLFMGQDNIFAAGGLVLGFNLQVPIFSSFERTYKLKQAQLERLKVERDLEQLNRGLQVAYTNARLGITDSYRRFQNGKRGFELAAKIRRVNTIKYQEGMVSSLVLTQAEQQYFDAQQRYYQAIFDLLLAKLALDKSLQKL